MDEIPYFHLTDDKEGILDTIVKCAVVGVTAAIGTFLVRRNGQKTILHNVNMALRDLPCTCEPKVEE